MIRLHANFSGMVQGVGFRFTVKRIANKYNITGFVRNIPNRQVEVVAEGDRGVVEDFIEDIRNGILSGYIRKVKKEWEPATGEYKEFEIRF